MKKVKALQNQKVCFSWKPLLWTLQMWKQLLRWLLEKYTTMLAGRFSTQTLTKPNYPSTGLVLLTMATLRQRKTVAIFHAVPEFLFCLFDLIKIQLGCVLLSWSIIWIVFGLQVTTTKDTSIYIYIYSKKSFIYLQILSKGF